MDPASESPRLSLAPMASSFGPLLLPMILILVQQAIAQLDSQTARPINKPNQDNVTLKCDQCKLVANSLDQLTRKPRQLDIYGQLVDPIDLDRVKKIVCTEYGDDNNRQDCRAFYFSHLDTARKWKQLAAANRVSFYDFVCIKELKFCCPRKSFGPRCSKCAECAPNEFCHGEGTRTGNGSCVCKKGYEGKSCLMCQRGYYRASSLGLSVACEPCHKSCQYCRNGGPLGCEVCSKGYTWLPSYGCSDIDECLEEGPKICGENTFCVNTEGSYFCYECDRACDGCNGDGPDTCLRCAVGYKLENGNCIATKQVILPPEANYYRYAIYAGLCLSTCIILHNNVYMASIIGLGVALYIGFSEYIVSKHTDDIASRTRNALSVGSIIQ